MMTYQEALTYIESLPKFAPGDALPGSHPEKLARMRGLLSRLGEPQKELHFVHVAGTNGKGSTAALIQNIFSEAGMRAGLFTSPALIRFTERIRIGRTEISEAELAKITETVRAACTAMTEEGLEGPSEYEVVCAAAMLYFKEKACDVVVLEVGMGGTRDATNVIDVPDLAVITPISLDHTQILGDTVQKIAGEKAGIIKAGGHVLICPQTDEAEAVLKEKCLEKRAVCLRASLPEKVTGRSLQGQTFNLTTSEGLQFDDLTITLLGSYQVNNAASACQAACMLRSCFPDRYGGLTDEVIRRGLQTACWPGRFEPVHENPCVILDGGHNPQGAQVLAESLHLYFGDRKIRFVIGILEDKDVDAMLGCVAGLAERFYTITPPSPRAMDAKKLAEFLCAAGYKAAAYDSARDALQAAMDDENAVVCVFGSLYSLSGVYEALSV